MELALFCAAVFVFFGGSFVWLVLNGDYPAAILAGTITLAAPWTYWMTA